MRFRKSDQKHVFTRSVSAYRELLIAAVFAVTIVRHRTSVLDKTACMCSKTSSVDNTKSVHNRSKPAVFVCTAQGLSSNQNEVAINSKSDLWRTALLLCLRRRFQARGCLEPASGVSSRMFYLLVHLQPLCVQ